MKKVIAFDLDDCLTITKSPISDHMGELLVALLDKHEVAIISGGKFEQFREQVIDRLEAAPDQLARLHIIPTCGTRYYLHQAGKWVQQYAEDLTAQEKEKIITTLHEAAKKLGFWEQNPYGEIIEDRGSQITLSALGQEAPPDKKYEWDPDHKKKWKLRDYVAPLLPDLEVRVGGSTSIDVTPIGIDKAYGMKKLMDMLKVAKKDILFVGDRLQEGGNDYPVKAMGIDCIAVEGPKETAVIIETILKLH